MELAAGIQATAIAVHGTAFMDVLEGTDPFMWQGCPGMKPHGRLCWSFHLGSGPYIDLSVVVPLRNPWGEMEVTE